MIRSARTGAVAIWTIDRPEAKNALDHATIFELAAIVDDAAKDATLRAAVLTGAGGVFVSGGDLKALRGKNTQGDGESFSDLGFALCRAIGGLPFPVAAAISGPAIGGGVELALSCDVRFGDRTLTFGFKQARMGVTTAWGTTSRLVALAGPAAAARLLYSALDVGAEEAERLRLVDGIADDANAAALAWASEVAKASPTAVAALKRLVRSAALEDRALERALFAATWSSPDHEEAVEAYFARRAPVWRDR